MQFPTRFHTGVRGTTIPNAAHLHKDTRGAKVFEGETKDYNFKKQSENFILLQKVLEANGTKFLYVAAATYPGSEYDGHTNHRFDAVAEDGSMLWHKYVGDASQSGQNHVFIGGHRIKVSRFLSQTPTIQTALLSGSEAVIDALLDVRQQQFLFEEDSLWN